MIRFIFILLVIFGMGSFANASHVMGGEITWVNQNGNYIFTLVFYRDCNGADVNTVSETIRVWNHPTITSITLPFVSRTDISPVCSQVAGSPQPLSCGSGTSGGNGIGAIEKVIYRSAVTNLSGTPPAQGWVFTYENFSRSTAITNLTNPSNYGTTIAAKMYAIPGNSGSDSSPLFLQEPYFVSCVGDPYVYNMNPVDPDLDSISITFGIPYNNFPSGSYNPPVNPIPVPFESGFSFISPTPNALVGPGSVAAQINPLTGELTFTSTLEGNYVVKALVKSFRHGVLIAEVEREMQLIVMACSAANNHPQITPPFAGNTSFTTTVNAGGLVTFNLTSSDNEFLQDGSPQSNIMSASGPMFGTGYTSNTGCAVAPCATLTPSPLITGNQGSTTLFNWQTSCDHLLGADGNALDLIPYNFVFRVQDNYCDVPKVSYATVTVNVVNPGVVQAPQIACIQTDASGNVTINWNSVNDPAGTFQSYQIYSVEDGLLTTIPLLSTSSWTDPNVTQSKHYYIAVASGCNGNTLRYSDTLSNILLDVTNPSDGTALLTWNNPNSSTIPGTGNFYLVYREYPTGTWALRDSVLFGTTFYRDTIDICESNLNYKIILPSLECDFTSNVDGGIFMDMLTPYIPTISSASIDTLTDQLILTWNVNPASDTYGYVVYTYDAGGFLVELDTVWGSSNTTYTHAPDITQGPLTYTVAAFDSCLTSAIPPTFQTSAKASIHKTVFLTRELDLCEKTIKLNWTPYIGWSNDTRYFIYGKTGSGSYTLLGQTNETTITLPVEQLKDYCFLVKAISYDSLFSAFSNRICLSVSATTQPAYHYLQNATVQGAAIDLYHLVDASSGVKAIAFERVNKEGVFEEIARVLVVADNIFYTDTAVDVQQYSYTYRARIVDSCGSLGAASNIARTILLNTQKDEVGMRTYLNWTPYDVWDGTVVAYRIYRDTGAGYSNPPLAYLPPTQFSFEDDLSLVSFNGKVCYYVEALEGDNRFNNNKLSTSNEACEVFEPIVYIPNAFTPGGVNPIFYPVLSLFDPNDYYFAVFDRWGQAIFQTNDATVGWDGIIQGTNKMASTGTYLYMVRMNNGDGNEIIRRGFVSLLK